MSRGLSRRPEVPFAREGKLDQRDLADGRGRVGGEVENKAVVGVCDRTDCVSTKQRWGMGWLLMSAVQQSGASTKWV